MGYSGLAGYVNAVLRNIARAKDEGKLDSYLVSTMDTRYSTPSWLCDFYVKTYGKEVAKAILEDQFARHETVVRVNTLKTNADELCKLFEAKGITVNKGHISDRSLRISGYASVRRLPGYKDGLFMIQDETSTYTIEQAGIKPGDKVLDICAAPGGKSLLAYELSTDSERAGTIVSRDISNNKLERIQENAERLGVPVRVLVDSQSEDLSKIEKLDKISFRYQPGINLEIIDAVQLDETLASLPDEEKFDIVLADVPCSGLGIIGRKNDIKYHMTPEIMEELATQGLRILSNASHYVKPGGRICYSTCTINPDENGAVVDKFLHENSDFEKIDERTFIQGIDGSDGFYYSILVRL
jgi:16S rRNA (cytosine967-C5)-methyltransferase